MQKTSLLSRIKKDFPAINLVEAEDFWWDFTSDTVFFCSGEQGYELLLLHEVAHRCLEHQDYSSDISLLRMEADAWNHVKTTLAPRYGVKFDEDLAEEHIDSYRNWLHKRSSCPNCAINGCRYGEAYKCPHCLGVWKVGEDRFKNTYRQKQNKHSG